MSHLELLIESMNQFVSCEKEKTQYFYNIKFHPDYKVTRLTNSLPLSYNNCLLLIHYLCLQQSFLERKKMGFFKLVLDDVVMIESLSDNELMFAYMNSTHIKNINDNGEINFMTPFPYNKGFFAPEILSVKTIPFRVSYKCFYYSLGLLIIFCINHQDNSENEKTMEKLKGTKMYWLLQRLLQIDPLKRVLLFV